MRLQDQVAIITGVSHAGQVGMALASGFAREGAKLAISFRGLEWISSEVIGMILGAKGGIAAHGGKLQSAPLMNAHFDARKFPVQAVDFLESTPQASTTSQGPVLSQDDWGGYLIYRLYPRIRVVVDDRHDLYGEVFLTSYLKMIHLEPGWQEFLEQHPAETIILPKDSAQANMLLETRGWRRVYADDVAIVFRRNPTKE